MRIRPVIGLSILAGLATIGLVVGGTAFSQATTGVADSDGMEADPAISVEATEGAVSVPEVPVATEPAPAAKQPIRVPSPAGAAPRGQASRRGSYTYVYDGKSGAVSGPAAPASVSPPQDAGYYSSRRSSGRYGPVYGGYVSPRPDPEMAKLLEADSEMEKQSKDLAEQYRQASDQKQRTELKTKLQGLCDQHFDVRQKRRQREVVQLEQQLKRIRDSIDKRNEARELIVRIRVSQLLGEEDELSF